MSKPAERTPPQNIDAERAVLGSALLNNDAIPTAIEVLGEYSDPFYVDAHRRIYDAIISVYREGDPVDFVTITEHLTASGGLGKCGGAVYIAELTDAVPTSANARYYAEIVREMWRRRSVIAACTRVAGELYQPESDTEDLLSELESATFQAANGHGPSKPFRVVEALPIVRDTLGRILDGGKLPGLRTGMPSVDKILRPMGPGDFIILAARPSIGKTTFVCNVVRGLMAQEVAVLFISLEVSKEMLVQKLLGIVAGVDMRMVESGKALKSPTEKALAKAAAEMSKWPLYIDDNPELSPLQMRAKIRQAVKDFGIGAVVIDYLGLINMPKAESRNIAVGECSRGIKLAAREAGIPIIALHQLNRQGAETQPKAHQLRDSGNLEQDADTIILLSKCDKEPQEPGRPEVILVDIDKQRNSATGQARMLFNKPLQRFQELSPEAEPQAPLPYADDRDPLPEDRYSEEYVNADEPF